MSALRSASVTSISSGISVSVDWDEIGRRVGGRFALSPVMVAISIPFYVGGYVATEYVGGAVGEWYLYLLVGFLAHLLLWLVFGVASVTVLRGHHSRPKPLWVTLSVYLFAGEVRLAALLVGIELLGLDNPIPTWVRIINTAVLFPLAYGFSSYSLESFRLYLSSRRDLIHSIVQAEIELDQQRGAVNSLRESFLGGFDQKIDDANQQTLAALDGLEEDITGGIDARPDLKRLLDEADRRWRGISHETLEAARITVPRPTVREFLDVVARSKPLSYLSVVLGAVFVFSLALGRQLPLLQGVLWSVIWMLVTLLLVYVTNTLANRFSRVATPLFIGLYAGIVLSGLWMAWIPGVAQDARFAAFSIHLTVVATSLLVGYGPATSNNLDNALLALRRHLDQASISRLKVESELVVLAQKVASRLHAENRGEFMAKVLNLQRSLDSGDTKKAVEDLRGVRQALRSEGPRDSDPGDDDLLRFLANWRGLVEIDSNLHVVNVPDALHPPINTIVMDAVNDAVRHGGADWVEIHLDDSGENVVLSIRNNGTPPNGGPGGGVGGKTLDRLATAGWSREVDVLGFTRLRVEFSKP